MPRSTGYGPRTPSPDRPPEEIPDPERRAQYRWGVGFFKKRAADREEMARLHAEVQSMSVRLEAADTDKRQLVDQVRTLASSVEQQRERLTTASARAAGDVVDELREQLLKLDRRIDEQVALHADNSPGVDAAAISGLRARLDAVDARLDAAVAAPAFDPDALDALQQRLDDLARRFDVPISAPPRTPPPPPLTAAPQLDDDTDEAADDATSDTDQLADIAALRHRVVDFGDRLDGVETRLVSISRELALQIDELSSELDRSGGEQGDPEIVALLAELRDAQSNLAAEQARYQIAFRADLADLADQLRHN